jgi:cephalosporin-C deacetylase-like acetyl esterase
MRAPQVGWLWLGAWVCFVVAPASPAAEPLPKVVLEWFAYDARQPLDVKVASTWDREGAVVQDLTFASPKGGRVPAYLVMPAKKSDHNCAGIVFGHWGGGNRTEFLPEAILLARAGVVSVLIDYPWERPAPWHKPVPNIGTPEEDRAVYAQAVVDLRRAFDLLLSRPEIDPKRLGYVGHSYGAQWGAILAAVDWRMKAAVLMGGVPTMRGLWTENEDPNMTAYRKATPPEKFERYLKVNGELDAVRFVPHAKSVALLFQFARQERIMNAGHARAYVDAARGPKEVRWYDSGHELYHPRALADRWRWLEKQLGIGPVEPILRHAVLGTGSGGQP